jgi:OOP family OmpA-OmpF porin
MGSHDIRAAAQMHAETGACIYAVQVGESEAGRAFLEKVVAAATCGKVVSARELQDSGAMADFVTMALLSRSAATSTPAQPKPADSDGDGVSDDKDKCPGTKRGAPVDADGCELADVQTSEEGTWRVSGEVLFGSNSAELRPEAQRVLSQIADFLQRNESIRVTIEGHTDSMGSEAHNQDLSQRRAQAAVDYIAAQGVAAARLSAVGKGESQPTAPNDTPENRAKNRRVEFIPSR